jgi:CrcB protein
MPVYLNQLLVVGLGGFLGSALRFMISGWAQRLSPMGAFPIGTLAVNVIGCLAIGLLGGLADQRQMLDSGQRLFLMVGVLGGFTTFSSFAFETLGLAQDGALLRVFANVLLQLLLGFGAAAAGYLGARFL